jgi:hypothetical protein
MGVALDAPLNIFFFVSAPDHSAVRQLTDPAKRSSLTSTIQRFNDSTSFPNLTFA